MTAKQIKDFIVEASKVVGAVVGAIAAAIGLVFLLMPNLIPWTSLRGDVSETSIEHNTTVKDFMNRAYLNPERPEDASLTVIEKPPSYKPQTMGNVISYKLEMEGFAQKTVRVYWSVYQASGQRIADETLTDQIGWPSNLFEARRRVDVVSGDAFVPLPKTDGIYFVKVGVWDGEGKRLDTVDSEEFEVVGGRSKEVPPDTDGTAET
jgi:hypothetical protein